MTSWKKFFSFFGSFTVCFLFFLPPCLSLCVSVSLLFLLPEYLSIRFFLSFLPTCLLTCLLFCLAPTLSFFSGLVQSLFFSRRPEYVLAVPESVSVCPFQCVYSSLPNKTTNIDSLIYDVKLIRTIFSFLLCFNFLIFLDERSCTNPSLSFFTS